MSQTNDGFSIAHFCTETQGGAGVAANRLNNGLRQSGIDSVLYFNKGVSTDKFSRRMEFPANLYSRISREVRTRLLQRQVRPGNLFTSPVNTVATSIACLPTTPDILHLHWISRWLDYPTFFRSVPGDLPIVWSLHDMNSFTGGCHLSFECEQYQNRCRRCPVLKQNTTGIAARNFKIKKKAYGEKNLHIVANSTWMLKAAKSAKLFENAASISMVHFGVDTETFIPRSQDSARDILNIPPDKFVICFGGADLNDKNKGILDLLDALAKLSSEKRENILLLLFGGGWPEVDTFPTQVISVGYVSNANLLSVVYSSSDILAFPSRFESFGLTALEAMSCGLPVVASNVGGITDFVVDGETGLLVSPGNSDQLANAIAKLVDNESLRSQIGKNGRKLALDCFSHAKTVDSHVRLYDSILGNA